MDCISDAEANRIWLLLSVIESFYSGTQFYNLGIKLRRIIDFRNNAEFISAEASDGVFPAESF